MQHNVTINEMRQVRHYSGFKTFIRNVVKYKALLLLMIPGFVATVINCYFPMFGVLMAFKNINYKDGILRSPWVGLSNFKFLFASDSAVQVTRNTVAFSLTFILLGLFFAVVTAVLLSEIRNKMASKFYQTALMLPNFLSLVVISIVVYSFLNPNYGFLNKNVLGPLFGMASIDWYSEPKYWIFILPVVTLWQTTGMSSVIYLASIAGMDQEIFEAAIVDGATKWQQVMNITLPMLKPIIIIMLLLQMGNIFRTNFGLFYQVTLNSTPLYPVTDTIDTYVYRALVTIGDMGMSSAAGLYQSLAGTVLTIGANLAVRKIDPDQALF